MLRPLPPSLGPWKHGDAVLGRNEEENTRIITKFFACDEHVLPCHKKRISNEEDAKNYIFHTKTLLKKQYPKWKWTAEIDDDDDVHIQGKPKGIIWQDDDKLLNRTNDDYDDLLFHVSNWNNNRRDMF